eukprot:4273771-Heterocapsa_arctica.AAC.1
MRPNHSWGNNSGDPDCPFCTNWNGNNNFPFCHFGNIWASLGISWSKMHCPQNRLAQVQRPSVRTPHQWATSLRRQH